MNKPDGFIKFLSILIIFDGLISFSEAFSFYLLSVDWELTRMSLPDTPPEFSSLVIGILVVTIGMGVWKLKKLALFGAAILVGYDIITTIINLFTNKIDSVVIMMVGLLLFRIYIYSYLWQKRAIFK